MNLFDAFAVLLVVIAVLLGYRSGALPQVGGLVGALIGGAVALLAVMLLERPLSDVDPGIRPYLVLVGLFGAVIVGESIGSSLGAFAGRGLRRSVFSGLDSDAQRSADAAVRAEAHPLGGPLPAPF